MGPDFPCALRPGRQALKTCRAGAASSAAVGLASCRGGLFLSQFDKNLECKALPGLFACGEVLNVDGECGGYNLHFAWASGVLAGREAVRSISGDIS